MVRLNFGGKACQISPYEHTAAPEIVPYYKKLDPVKGRGTARKGGGRVHPLRQKKISRSRR